MPPRKTTKRIAKKSVRKTTRRRLPAGVLKVDKTKDFPQGSQVLELKPRRIPIAATAGPSGERAITLQEWANLFAENGGIEDALGGLLRKSPWAFRCVEINAKSLAAIPWGLFRGEAEVEQGPYWELLQTVNDETNWQDLISYTGADLDVYGMAFWLKVRVGRIPRFLLRINPSSMKVYANQKGVQKFEQTLQDGRREYRRRDVVWFKLYDPQNDFGAISPLMACRNAILAESEADQHLKEFFENKAMPDYVMSLETTNQNELKRLSDFWQKEFAGEGNRHKVGWIGGKGKPEMIGYAPENLALEVVRAEFRRQICAAFGVPPALVGAWEAANYATIREQRQSLYTERLLPIAKYMEGVINAELSAEFGEEKFRWLPETLPALADNENDRVKRYAWLVQAEIIKPEVAAIALGYKKEDVPEPKPEQPFPNNNFENETGKPANDLREDKKAELIKFQRKALRALKDGKSAAVDFESAELEPFAIEDIRKELEIATTPDEVKALFNRHMKGEPVRDDEMVSIMREMARAAKTEITIKADNITMTQEPPIVNVSPPNLLLEPRINVEVQPTPIEVNNAINVAPTPIEAHIDTRPIAETLDRTAKAEKIEPRLTSRHEKQKVKRDKGEITGSETDVEYHYD